MAHHTKMDRLIEELTNDPRYDSMSDKEVETDINTPNRTRENEEITNTQLYEATVPTEVDALDASTRAQYDDLMRLIVIHTKTGSRGRTTLEALFPGGTATRANLDQLWVEQISRAMEIETYVPTTEGQVQEARMHMARSTGRR